MYSREKRVLLREYLSQGWNKSDLAEKLGISRWTVHHWIATGQLDRELDEEKVVYKSRPPVERKIDRYAGIITSRLDTYPKLSAVSPSPPMPMKESKLAAGLGSDAVP